MSQGIQNRIGPYLYADGAVRRRVIGKTTYIVGIAGAYDAFGLIGPEHNGLFVLDDTNKRVLTDRVAEETTGYHGPSKAQWQALERVMKLPARQFQSWIEESPRYRGA
jgi:hypothetical protein